MGRVPSALSEVSDSEQSRSELESNNSRQFFGGVLLLLEDDCHGWIVSLKERYVEIVVEINPI